MCRFAPSVFAAFLFLSCLPAPGAAQAPPAASVSLDVVTVDGREVPGAELALWQSGAAAGPAHFTDARGRFTFEAVAPGAYRLMAAAPGLSPVIVDVVVTPGETTRLTVVLPALLNERVNVIGNANALDRIPGAAAVVGADEIAAQAIGPADVHRILRRLPGLNLQEEEGYGLRPNIGIRGSGSERSSKITLMEDGVLAAPAPYAAPAAYYFPTVARMDAIEVMKGASQVRHGPATTGGVLNLVSTPIPADFRLRASLAAGSDDLGKLSASVGSQHGNVGWLVETYQLQNRGFKQLDGGGDTGVTLQDYLAKFRYQTRPSGDAYQAVEVKAGRTEQRGDETYLGLTDADFAGTPLRRYAASREDVFESTHTQFQVRHLFARRTWDVTTVAYRNDFERAWYKLQSVRGAGLSGILEAPEAFGAELAIVKGEDSEADALAVRNNNRAYYGAGVQTVFGLRGAAFGARHQLQAGLRVHRDEEDRLQQDDHFRMTSGRMILTTAGTPGSQANRVGDARAVSSFVTTTTDWGRWTVTPGLRVETIRLRRTDYAATDPARQAATGVRTNDVDVVVPGLGVTYLASPGVSLFGGVHRGFAPPGPGSTEETEAERSVAYELGTRVTRAGWRAEVTGFLSRYANLLGRDTLSSGGEGTGDLFNGGRAGVWGVEASATWDLAPRLGRADLEAPVRVAYTYTAAEFGHAFDSAFGPWGEVEVGDELPYTPRHQVFAGVEAAYRDLTVSLEGVYVGRMRTLAGQGPFVDSLSTDAHVVVNVSAGWALRDGARLVAAVQNVGDRRYIVARQPAGARPGLPRQVFLGLAFDVGR
jgi:Fe(3+) dicitrate transport protein